MAGLPASTSGEFVLQPNRTPASRNTQAILMEVSSRDRNFNNQVAPNPLKVLLNRPIKDVKSLELISGTIPAKPFNIVKGNNRFEFVEGDAAWTIVFSPGYYTASTLVTYLQTKLNGLSGRLNIYSCTLTSEGYLLVTATRPGTSTPLAYTFAFLTGDVTDEIDRSDGVLIKMNTPANLLGFDMADYTSTASGTLRSPYLVDPVSCMTRLYLHINFNTSLDLNTIERSGGRRSPFAVIYLDSDTNGYKYLNKETFTPASYSLPQPLSRLQSLNIEFRDEFYRLIDFGGKEFSLLLQFTVLE
jgi:hypothetical protein